MAERKKFGDKFYTKSECSLTKAAASKRAETMRKEGKNARIVEENGKFCLYTRKAAAVNGVKKRTTAKKKA
jgi:hypothetical protein